MPRARPAAGESHHAPRPSTSTGSIAYVPLARPLPFFVLDSSLIAAGGYVVRRRWSRPLAEPGDRPSALARRRAVLLPYALAGTALAAWALAGVLWGVVAPLLAGAFTPARSARLVFGVTGIGGMVTTAFLFFAAEHRWRKVLPRFFADGDLSAMTLLRPRR